MIIHRIMAGIVPQKLRNFSVRLSDGVRRHRLRSGITLFYSIILG
ncbi:hypothetical protein NYE48_17825 [Paenibacillus sp. FSL M7-1455]